MTHGNTEALKGNSNAAKIWTRNKSIKIYLYPDELIDICTEAEKLGYTNVNKYARDMLTNAIIDNKEVEAITEDFRESEGWNELSKSEQQALIEMRRLMKE